MGVGERSFSDVLQDIVHNVQDLVRSEIRLAKTELREEAVKAKASALAIGAGAVTSVFAILFLLLAIFAGLALFMPYWAAALIVGGVLALAGTLMLSEGIKRFKLIHPTPKHTVESIKENIEWTKQQLSK